MISAVGRDRFEHVVSVPLVMEYESVLLRPGVVPLSASASQDIIDFLCRTGVRQDVHFLWRPRLADPSDDMVLEAAVNGRCDAVVTHNVRDFAGSMAFGVQALTPAQFLSRLEEPAP